MKPTLYGEMNLVFSKELDHCDKDLALLQASYETDDLVAEKVELVITNIYGKRTILKVEDWSARLVEMCDEDGLPV